MSDVTTMCKHKIRVWEPVPWSMFGPSPPIELISVPNTFVWGSREGDVPSSFLLIGFFHVLRVL